MDDENKFRGQYVCTDAQGMALQYPDTFDVDSITDLRRMIGVGSVVKVCIELNGADDPSAERIWTVVESIDECKIKATFLNQPFFLRANHGDPVEFELRHIYSVELETELNHGDTKSENERPKVQH